MSTEFPNTTLPETADEIHAFLERCLIKEYLQNKGYTPESLEVLPENEAQQLRREASTYASGKLSEIEIRARFTADLQDAGHSAEA